MGCPEKGSPKRRQEMNDLNAIGHSDSVSAKEDILGRRRAAATPRPGTRTALYLRVSTADQKPDLQYDGLRGHAARAGLDVVQDYCDVYSATTKLAGARHEVGRFQGRLGRDDEQACPVLCG